MLEFLLLDLGGSTYLNHADRSGQVVGALGEFLTVVVVLCSAMRVPDGLDAPLDGVGVPMALNQHGFVFADGGAVQLTEIGKVDRVPADAHLLGGQLGPGEDGVVFEHPAPPLAEGGRLDGHHIQRAADPVQHQESERFPLDVLGDDEQAPVARLDELFQERQYVGRG